MEWEQVRTTLEVVGLIALLTTVGIIRWLWKKSKLVLKTDVSGNQAITQISFGSNNITIPPIEVPTRTEYVTGTVDIPRTIDIPGMGKSDVNAIKTVTQGEYDALPIKQEKTLYFITNRR